MLYMGEGPRGSNATRSTLHQVSATPSASHNQIGPLWCWFPSGWACAHSRPLWVSPTTSPVRLGVSPAAPPTPTGVFNQRSEALFPHAGALGYMVCFAPCRSSGSICARMWGRRVCQWSDCLPRLSHSPPVSVLPGQRESSLPRLPVSAPPTGLDECLFCFSLVLDPLAIRFSVSSGCARRRSVSTYASILVLPNFLSHSISPPKHSPTHRR